MRKTRPVVMLFSSLGLLFPGGVIVSPRNGKPCRFRLGTRTVNFNDGADDRLAQTLFHRVHVVRFDIYANRITSGDQSSEGGGAGPSEGIDYRVADEAEHAYQPVSNPQRIGCRVVAPELSRDIAPDRREPLHVIVGRYKRVLLLAGIGLPVSAWLAQEEDVLDVVWARSASASQSSSARAPSPGRGDCPPSPPGGGVGRRDREHQRPFVRAIGTADFR